MFKKIVDRRVLTVLESRGYSDLVLAGISASVAGSSGDILRTGALEVAASLWGRVLASADVSGTDLLRPRHPDNGRPEPDCGG